MGSSVPSQSNRMVVSFIFSPFRVPDTVWAILWTQKPILRRFPDSWANACKMIERYPHDRNSVNEAFQKSSYLVGMALRNQQQILVPFFRMGTRILLSFSVIRGTLNKTSAAERRFFCPPQCGLKSRKCIQYSAAFRTFWWSKIPRRQHLPIQSEPP